jgi:hypothetical protein
MVDDPIAKLTNASGVLLSVYINRLPQGASAQLADLLKPIRSRLDNFDRANGKALRNDLDRVHALAPRLDAETAPAVAIFASSADGILSYQPLTFTVWDHASIGPRAYLRPLRARPRPLRSGVAVADRRRVSFYLGEDGQVKAFGSALEADRLKSNYGGFAGKDEHRVRHHADEATGRLWKEAAAVLFDVHQKRPLDLVVVGGHEESLDGFVAHLHPYLKALPVCHLVVDPHTLTASSLRNQVEDKAAGIRRERQENMVEILFSAVERGGPAAVGTVPVLSAINGNVVDHLVVAGPFTTQGFICGSCHFLGQSEPICPRCSEKTFPVDDLVAEMMEEVLAHGGRTDQVGIPTRLDSFGVGALLRYGPP